MSVMFKLGTLSVTQGISAKAKANRKFLAEINEAFIKYVQYDWGDTHLEDAKSNDEAIKNGDRVLAAYKTSQGKIWIVTEADRSATTILFPDEY